jgi:hypothetical protein
VLGRGPAGQSKVRLLETTCNNKAGRSTIKECNKEVNEQRGGGLPRREGGKGGLSFAGKLWANQKRGVWRPREVFQ